MSEYFRVLKQIGAWRREEALARRELGADKQPRLESVAACKEHVQKAERFLDIVRDFLEHVKTLVDLIRATPELHHVKGPLGDRVWFRELLYLRDDVFNHIRDTFMHVIDAPDFDVVAYCHQILLIKAQRREAARLFNAIKETMGTLF